LIGRAGNIGKIQIPSPHHKHRIPASGGQQKGKFMSQCRNLHDKCITKENSWHGTGICLTIVLGSITHGQWRTQKFFRGEGVQQIQFRTEGRENGDLGAVAL
jgi:hypothetical protein